jgi:hypothetical protein
MSVGTNVYVRVLRVLRVYECYKCYKCYKCSPYRFKHDVEDAADTAEKGAQFGLGTNRVQHHSFTGTVGGGGWQVWGSVGKCGGEWGGMVVVKEREVKE